MLVLVPHSEILLPYSLGKTYVGYRTNYEALNLNSPNSEILQHMVQSTELVSEIGLL